MKKNKEFITSGMIGVFTGALLGWSIGGTLQRLLNLEGMVLLISSIILFAFFGLLLDLKKPVLVESLSYGIVVLIFFQAWWDYGAADWSSWRSVMATSAIMLLLLNLFTGHLRINTFKKVIRRQLGIGR